MKGCKLQPADLLKTARLLASSARGKPSQANLRRAVSSAYYAMFHCLARICADSLLGGPGAQKGDTAWRQTYRALEHGSAKNACSNRVVMSRFSSEIQEFAAVFVQLQEKRHRADYDPFEKLFKSGAVIDIQVAEQAIEGFRRQSLKDRRAFCVHVLFKHRSA